MGGVPAHRPDDCQEAHQEGEAGRPLGAIRDGGPDVRVGVSLGRIDRASGEPDEEDDQHDEIDDGAELVEPAEESRRVHC